MARTAREAYRNRKLLTGRYETRQELVDAVHYYRLFTYLTYVEIGEVCRISHQVVHKILSKEQPDDYIHLLGSQHQLLTHLTEEEYGTLQRLGVFADRRGEPLGPGQDAL